MAEVPSTHYVKSGDVYIAYQVFGEGSLDLIFVPGFVSNIEAMWQSPNLRCAEHLERSRVRACGAVWHFRGQPDVLAAATYPERTSALVLYGAYRRKPRLKKNIETIRGRNDNG